jgi:hypothetical protein
MYHNAFDDRETLLDRSKNLDWQHFGHYRCIFYLLLSSSSFGSSRLALALFQGPLIVAVIKQWWQQESALVLEHEPVPRHALLEVNDSVVGIGHGPLVDPGVDFLVGSELQHLPDLGGGTDEGATDLDLLQDEAESHETRYRIFRSANLNELATDVEQTEVFGKGHAGAGDGADNQVERVGVLGLVALLGGSNLDELLVGSEFYFFGFGVDFGTGGSLRSRQRPS